MGSVTAGRPAAVRGHFPIALERTDGTVVVDLHVFESLNLALLSFLSDIVEDSGKLVHSPQNRST